MRGVWVFRVSWLRMSWLEWRASDGGPRAMAWCTCVVLFMLLCTRVLVAALRLVMMMMMMMRVVAGAADVKVAFEDD
jgi:hypothetical protein